MKAIWPNLEGIASSVPSRSILEILIMWGRPLVCRLRCLWLRWGAETSCAGKSEFLPPNYPKMRIAGLMGLIVLN